MQPPWHGSKEVLTIVVWDTPQPQGSKRAFNHKTTGKVVVVSDNHPKLKTWREAVKTAARDAIEGHEWEELTFPLEGEVAMAVTFTRPRPKSAPKWRRIWAITRPDLDKQKRAVGDACKAANVYKDDSQIVESHEWKDYPLAAHRRDPGKDRLSGPGAVIRVWRPVDTEVPEGEENAATVA